MDDEDADFQEAVAAINNDEEEEAADRGSRVNPVIIDSDSDSDSGSSTTYSESSSTIYSLSRLSQKEELGTNNDGSISLWAQLPVPALATIYSYLPDEGRYRMSCTCKSWYQVFHCAPLWRKRSLHFGGYRGGGGNAMKESQRAIGYAKKFGQHLQHLVITCEHPSVNCCKKFQKAISKFFGFLTWRRAKIRKLYITQLHADRFWRLDFVREKLTESIAKLLRRQRYLEILDMSECMYGFTNGLQVLEAAAEQCSHKIKHLNIEDFFCTRLVVHTVSRFRRVISHFHSLRSLYLNYNYINDDILETLTCNNAKHFNSLSIKVYKHDPHFHRTDPDVWRRLRQACPALRVAVYFEGIGDYFEISRVLNREMPLKTLQVWTGIHHLEEHWHLEDTFRYLSTHFSRTISEISMGIENGRETIDEALLWMLERCRHLERLELQAQVLVSTIETICRLQRVFKIGLEKCHITAENLTGIELQELDAITSVYEDMVYERGLDFHFSANEMPYL